MDSWHCGFDRDLLFPRAAHCGNQESFFNHRIPSFDAHGNRQVAVEMFAEFVYAVSADKDAEVAQLVEHIPEEDGVGGSSPPLGTYYYYGTTRNIKRERF